QSISCGSRDHSQKRRHACQPWRACRCIPAQATPARQIAPPWPARNTAHGSSDEKRAPIVRGSEILSVRRNLGTFGTRPGMLTAGPPITDRRSGLLMLLLNGDQNAPREREAPGWSTRQLVFVWHLRL